SMSIGTLVIIFQLSLQLADAIKGIYDLIYTTMRRIVSIDNLKEEYNRNNCQEKIENNILLPEDKITISLEEASYK
ncbi:ABC transporter ATP-binding protein, partial [Bacillus toyonensis]